ncbi:MAG: NAD(+)/NADH kinase [Candidatus Nitrosotenuis sp.]|uniref:NAD kinase n=1 Tax=Candidatus Nitrosotenuis uzonensis TaxID=1407055 RepID=V6AT52_9ARCH|nr:NAD(+)/NADH kinase [Candidatus Nitrosotenuis uzonensis]CDI05690.1 putative inorganic polyphosphate/ATP-NAD kinase 2 [Candidatus Nitrosotenuis uzonensis]
MHIGISGLNQSDIGVKTIKTVLDDYGITSSYVGYKPKKDTDCIIVTGGDRGVRNYFHKTLDPQIPILGVSESEASGFLAQIDLKEFSAYVNRIKKGDYQISEFTRLGVKIDGRPTYSVINDVAVFPSKSAMLMEHILRVNSEEVWHDSSDGVIVSTPIGSSAYSMSAGGPMIFQDSPVFGIVSVNSLDITRRPLIVSDSSTIVIDDISARLYCEVVLDGVDRLRINNTLECTKSSPSARIIKMKKDSTAVSALTKKVKLAEELLNMPPSSKLLLKTLEYEGSMTQKELAQKTVLPDRTVRLALRHLLDKGYVKKKISIRDARQKIYEISKID